MRARSPSNLSNREAGRENSYSQDTIDITSNLHCSDMNCLINLMASLTINFSGWLSGVIRTFTAVRSTKIYISAIRDRENLEGR